MGNDLFFAPEDSIETELLEPWNILIVDDESSVHDVTKLALHQFTYKGRGVNFTSAFSGKEAKNILDTENFAVAFIDVIMESDEAGLDLVDYIRKDLQDDIMRIIIRTGQPGLAPERFVIDNYDINDYKEKTELTAERLYTSLRTALSQYDQLQELAHKSELLYHRINFDPLTSLPNRTNLNEVLELRKDSSLFMINIDSFSLVNGAYGFEYGDAVLKSFAVQLQQLLVDDEVFYRLEADTFALHITHKDKTRLKRVQEELVDFSHKFYFEQEGISVRLSFSMGIVLRDHENLIQKADMALKEARSVSRNSMQIYNDNMDVIHLMHENREWTRILNKALEKDQLVPYFQPILNVKTELVEKYEALARLDLNGTIIQPLEFLAAARYGGLLHKITRVMLEKTAKAFALNSYRFSINITDQDFKEDDFVPFVKETLRKYRISPDRIIFELLEDKSLKGLPQAKKIVEELLAMGCHIAIDDFGVECSNYAQLITHKLESIKIDGSFIKNLDKSDDCQRVVDAIIYFSKSMDIRTVAEFVHSQAIYDKAVALGVDYVQGYYIGEPKPDID